MRTFAELREKLGRHPSGQMVFNKKIDRIPVMIHKERMGYVVYLDGDRLDSYRTQREAEKNLRLMEQTQRILHTNVTELLALEIGLLKLKL